MGRLKSPKPQRLKQLRLCLTADCLKVALLFTWRTDLRALHSSVMARRAANLAAASPPPVACPPCSGCGLFSFFFSSSGEPLFPSAPSLPLTSTPSVLLFPPAEPSMASPPPPPPPPQKGKTHPCRACP